MSSSALPVPSVLHVWRRSARGGVAAGGRRRRSGKAGDTAAPVSRRGWLAAAAGGCALAASARVSLSPVPHVGGLALLVSARHVCGVGRCNGLASGRWWRRTTWENSVRETGSAGTTLGSPPPSPQPAARTHSTRRASTSSPPSRAARNAPHRRSPEGLLHVCLRFCLPPPFFRSRSLPRPGGRRAAAQSSACIRKGAAHRGDPPASASAACTGRPAGDSSRRSARRAGSVRGTRRPHLPPTPRRRRRLVRPARSGAAP